MKKYKKGSFVVVSDFHSYRWPLEKIKDYYLDEYETIYILGDVTDRGELSDGSGGLGILRDIKRLSERYPGRIVYVPGNHDDFLFQYAKYRDFGAERNLKHNHGSQTIKDIDELRQTNPREFRELIEWLGNLPLQREHYYNGQRYVLAHALFNEKLFKENKDFSLEDYRANGSHFGEYKNLLWFRKGNDEYDKSTLPRKDSIMVIGHTPLMYREGENLDLINSYGEIVQINCVDGGIAYDGRMQKFIGGVGVNDTFNGKHNDTSELVPEENENKEQIESKVNKIILTYINNSSSLEEAVNKILGIIYSIGDGHFNINGAKRETISKKEVKEYLEEVYMSYIPTNGNVNKKDIDYMEIFKLHFTKVALDYITKCQFKKFESRRAVINQMEGFITEKDFSYITNSVGSARDIAEKIGVNNFIKWIRQSKYKSFDEYINSEFGKQYDKR